MVSSAYTESLALPAPGRLIPVVFCLMFSSKGSSVSMYRRGERLYPCLMSENGSPRVWLTNNWLCGFLYSVLIHVSMYLSCEL